MTDERNIILGCVILGIFGVILLTLLYLMFSNLKVVIQWLKSSLQDPVTGNASSKRLSGLWMMVLVTAVHFVWLKNAFTKDNFALLPEILWADLAFVVSALGISAWQSKLTQNNNSNNQSNPEEKK